MGQFSLPLPPRSLLARELILAAGMLVLAVCVAPLAHSFGGWPGVGAELIALGICWLPFSAALSISYILGGPAHALPATLLAMAIRTGVPLLFLIPLHLCGGLDRNGLLYYVLTFYLAGLMLETWLSLPRPAEASGHDQSHSGPADRTDADGVTEIIEGGSQSA